MGSTNFDIIPIETDQISFQDVLQLSEKHINTFLNRMGILSTIQLRINAYEDKIDLDSTFAWLGTTKDIWFELDGIEGEISVDCYPIHQHSTNSWRLDAYLQKEKQNKTIPDFDKKIEQSKQLSHFWSLSCDSQELGIIHLSYGLLAASIAELTGGFIDTSNGAWLYDEFPAEAPAFLKSYFITDNRSEKGVVDSMFIFYAKKHLKGLHQEIPPNNNH